MEEKLTVKRGIASLVFPVLVLVAALSFFSGFTLYLGDLRLDYNFQRAFQLIAGLGGVLPIILTFVLKADTSPYLLRRLVFLFASIGLLALFAAFLGRSRRVPAVLRRAGADCSRSRRLLRHKVPKHQGMGDRIPFKSNALARNMANCVRDRHLAKPVSGILILKTKAEFKARLFLF